MKQRGGVLRPLEQIAIRWNRGSDPHRVNLLAPKNLERFHVSANRSSRGSVSNMLLIRNIIDGQKRGRSAPGWRQDGAGGGSAPVCTGSRSGGDGAGQSSAPGPDSRATAGATGGGGSAGPDSEHAPTGEADETALPGPFVFRPPEPLTRRGPAPSARESGDPGRGAENSGPGRIPSIRHNGRSIRAACGHPATSAFISGSASRYSTCPA